MVGFVGAQNRFLSPFDLNQEDARRENKNNKINLNVQILPASPPLPTTFHLMTTYCSSVLMWVQTANTPSRTMWLYLYCIQVEKIVNFMQCSVNILASMYFLLTTLYSRIECSLELFRLQSFQGRDTKRCRGPKTHVLGQRIACLRLNDGAKLWISFKLCFKTNIV